MSSRKSRHFAPAVATDRDVARLSFAAQFLYHRLHSDGVDDQGRFIADLRHVMITCVPYVDEFDDQQVTVCLKEMADARLVCLYEAPGEVLGQLIHWWRDQTGTIAFPSDLAAPPGWEDSYRFRVRHGDDSEYETLNWPPKRDAGAKFLSDAGGPMFLGTVRERSRVAPTSKALQVTSEQNKTEQGIANRAVTPDDKRLRAFDEKDRAVILDNQRLIEQRQADLRRQRQEPGTLEEGS